MDEKWARVAVVVLCWNGKKLLEQFLPSLIKYQSPDSDIVVADNCSTDDSVLFLKQNFPTVKLIQFEKNFGFAEGYNLAIKRIGSEYIVLINQDVEVTGNWMPPLVKMMDINQNIGAVQPKIKSFTDKNRFEYAGAAGGFIDELGYTFCRGRVFDFVEGDRGQYNSPSEIFWASGACMITRKKIYEALGGLDARLFAHMEEIDLCWRMQHEGLKIMYCPESTVYHLGGGSLPQGNPYKTFLNFRNNLIILYKNIPSSSTFGTILLRIMLDKIAALRSLLSGNVKDFASIIKGIWTFILGLGKWKTQYTTKQPKPLRKLSGVFSGSLAWNYFLKKKKTFSEIFRSK